MDYFINDLEEGIVQNKFPSNPGFWRVSSLVQLWDEYRGGGKCEKLLYLYLLHGGEKDFEKDTLKRFDVGHKVHDLVKEYFAKSPNFVVKHDEYSVKHPVLPLTGTIDHIVEWERFPGEEFIVEITSPITEYVLKFELEISAFPDVMAKSKTLPVLFVVNAYALVSIKSIVKNGISSFILFELSFFSFLISAVLSTFIFLFFLLLK